MAREVQIWLENTSEPIIHKDVTSTYQKGDMFCVYTAHQNDFNVTKYPINHIFRVREQGSRVK